jgi:hypothetical protein
VTRKLPCPENGTQRRPPGRRNGTCRVGAGVRVPARRPRCRHPVQPPLNRRTPPPTVPIFLRGRQLRRRRGVERLPSRVRVGAAAGSATAGPTTGFRDDPAIAARQVCCPAPWHCPRTDCRNGRPGEAGCTSPASPTHALADREHRLVGDPRPRIRSRRPLRRRPGGRRRRRAHHGQRVRHAVPVRPDHHAVSAGDPSAVSRRPYAASSAVPTARSSPRTAAGSIRRRMSRLWPPQCTRRLHAMPRRGDRAGSLAGWLGWPPQPPAAAWRCRHPPPFEFAPPRAGGTDGEAVVVPVGPWDQADALMAPDNVASHRRHQRNEPARAEALFHARARALRQHMPCMHGHIVARAAGCGELVLIRVAGHAGQRMPHRVSDHEQRPERLDRPGKLGVAYAPAFRKVPDDDGLDHTVPANRENRTEQPGARELKDCRLGDIHDLTDQDGSSVQRTELGHSTPFFREPAWHSWADRRRQQTSVWASPVVAHRFGTDRAGPAARLVRLVRPWPSPRPARGVVRYRCPNFARPRQPSSSSLQAIRSSGCHAGRLAENHPSPGSPAAACPWTWPPDARRTGRARAGEDGGEWIHWGSAASRPFTLRVRGSCSGQSDPGTAEGGRTTSGVIGHCSPAPSWSTSSTRARAASPSPKMPGAPSTRRAAELPQAIWGRDAVSRPQIGPNRCSAFRPAAGHGSGAEAAVSTRSDYT